MNVHIPPPRPSIPPFTALPSLPAIHALRARKQWVAWDFLWRENPRSPQGGDWTKPPFNPKTGTLASHSNPATWGTYDEAADCAQKRGLAGVGYVLSSDDEITGIDLDKCRDPESGNLEPWAAEIIAIAETYAEVSPSGTGIRILSLGKAERTIKCDQAHVEIYQGKRYLTITGHHVEGTPTDIRPAPRMIEMLKLRVEAFKVQPAAQDVSPPVVGTKKNGTKSVFGFEPNPFFKTVNAEALTNLDKWVPAIFRADARYQPGTQGYRVSSTALGRPLQEDLSITPMGIRDWGVDDQSGGVGAGARTAIDLVKEHRGERTAAEAAFWLCDQLGLNPAAIGWNGAGASSCPQQHTTDTGIDNYGDEDRADERPSTAYLSFGPYRMGRAGLYHDAGGDSSPTWLAEPFEILAATRDEIGSSWGLMLRWRDLDNREHTWALPRSLLYGDGAAVCGALADQGLSVAPGVKARTFLLGYLAFAKPVERVTCVGRTGWHETGRRNAYVLPDETYGDTPENRLVLQVTAIVRSPFDVRGSLQEWQDKVARPCEHNSRLVFAISAALAGPLLAPTNTEGGGFPFQRSQLARKDDSASGRRQRLGAWRQVRFGWDVEGNVEWPRGRRSHALGCRTCFGRDSAGRCSHRR